MAINQSNAHTWLTLPHPAIYTAILFPFFASLGFQAGEQSLEPLISYDITHGTLSVFTMQLK